MSSRSARLHTDVVQTCMLLHSGFNLPSLNQMLKHQPFWQASHCHYQWLRRAEPVLLDPSDREEVKHVKKALTANGYMKWIFEILRRQKIPPRTGQLPRISLSVSPIFWAYQNNFKECSDPKESPHTTNLSTLWDTCWCQYEITHVKHGDSYPFLFSQS